MINEQIMKFVISGDYRQWSVIDFCLIVFVWVICRKYVVVFRVFIVIVFFDSD